MKAAPRQTLVQQWLRENGTTNERPPALRIALIGAARGAAIGLVLIAIGVLCVWLRWLP
ncbi:hypothetical protein [Methylobacterium gnaphalii]|uniref:Uncharacterized protein n=1 Tax=Methylobacterium gnaphalii TaxID=1010610 RepID=A0A512JP33_9HYPH|nr:hypothetical protein [Methylobacterium gnaphalii]GEP11623.1 hypothetical protein MGN01_34680 [Methylobacterium gnaphalii]GJD69574.1 hypothetical protein MMMDOFMJ_2511 [Methylobacterium gnaphalii]GLS49114.1 hypothetical protein GCM10007885_19620 [Methylobacterium gnaphalii]